MASPTLVACLSTMLHESSKRYTVSFRELQASPNRQTKTSSLALAPCKTRLDVLVKENFNAISPSGTETSCCQSKSSPSPASVTLGFGSNTNSFGAMETVENLTLLPQGVSIGINERSSLPSCPSIRQLLGAVPDSPVKNSPHWSGFKCGVRTPTSLRAEAERVRGNSPTKIPSEYRLTPETEETSLNDSSLWLLLTAHSSHTASTAVHPTEEETRRVLEGGRVRFGSSQYCGFPTFMPAISSRRW